MVYMCVYTCRLLVNFKRNYVYNAYNLNIINDIDTLYKY